MLDWLAAFSYPKQRSTTHNIKADRTRRRNKTEIALLKSVVDFSLMHFRVMPNQDGHF
jgi:hypothetical protein